MSARRVVTWVFSLAAAAAATVPLVLLAPLGSGDDASPPRSDGSLPWPYCEPDATPPPPTSPSPTPWPPPPTLDPGGTHVDGNVADLNPYTSAIVLVSAMVPSPEPLESYQEHPWIPQQKAEVVIDEVVWQTAFARGGSDEIPPVPPGPTVVVGDQEAMIEASEALVTGARIALGIDWLFPDGSYGASFAFDADPEEPEFFGPYPYAERETGQFRAFLSWEGNPVHASDDALDLLVAWNVEADGPYGVWPKTGPISLAWSDWWATLSAPAYDFPNPRTEPEEYWAKAPPQCRNVLDAPEAVLTALRAGGVWFHVPDSWRGLQDSMLCLAISQGSMDCASVDLVGAWSYFDFDEVYAVPGEPIKVQVARLKEQAPSWIERVVIGTIPWGTFSQTGIAIVELDSAFTASSYAVVQAHPNPSSLSSARSMTTQEERELILQGPLISPDPESCAPDCP